VLVAINYDDCELRKLRLERRTFQADLFASEVEHGDVGRGEDGDVELDADVHFTGHQPRTTQSDTEHCTAQIIVIP